MLPPSHEGHTQQALAKRALVPPKCGNVDATFPLGSPEKTQHLGVWGRAGHVGTLCLALIRIPDSQGEQVLAVSHVVLASSPGLGAIVSSWGKVGNLQEL